DDVLDGIVYGALVGLGFAMTENVFYFMSILLDDGWGAWSLAIFLRSVIFGFNHAFFTSLVGIGLGLARTVRSREVRWGAPVVALGAAIVFHAVHNAGASLASLNCLAMGVSLLADWGGFWIVVAIIILSWRQERRWIWEYLADEGISESDRRAALSARWRSRVWLRRPRGSRAAWRSAGEDYYQLLAELAFRKRRLARLGDEPGLREDIARLRAQIREVQRRKA
ncbi:MAG TPA: PrsW family intramembrane metalloprotease, partial [Caldilineae bacterium]|nr:PrsW family intramembrane metalloprotease [Caldilineae bacterium]